MKIHKYYLTLFLTFLIIGCNKINNDCEITSIIIESRRSYKDNVRVIVSDEKIVNEIKSLNKKSISIGDKPNLVKSNLGFIELYHVCGRSKINILTLIYTKYNGVIIRTGPGDYNFNYRLKNYIEQLFENPDKFDLQPKTFKN